MAAAIEADVRSILPPIREGKIDRAYTNAWNDWWKSQDRPRLSRWDRTRANNIFEYLTTHLMDEFADDSGARFIFGRETFKLIFDNQLVARFKKTGSDGMGSNIGTQAEIDWGDAQTDLPGFSRIQKVEIDYVVNVTGTAIAKIIVLARNGKNKMWDYEIASSQGGAEVLTRPQPTPPLTPIDSLVKERKTGKPKKSAKGKE